MAEEEQPEEELGDEGGAAEESGVEGDEGGDVGDDEAPGAEGAASEEPGAEEPGDGATTDVDIDRETEATETAPLRLPVTS